MTKSLPDYDFLFENNTFLVANYNRLEYTNGPKFQYPIMSAYSPY